MAFNQMVIPSPPDAPAVAGTLMAASRQLAAKSLPPELAHLAEGPLGEALDKAVDFAHQALAPATEQVYAVLWADFAMWCRDHGAPALPAVPAIVAAYLAERSSTLGRSRLRMVLAAIAYRHRRSGHLWIARDPVITSVMKGILRRQKKPVRPAAALTSEELRQMLAAFGDELADARDRALLLTGFAGALRRSELVALDRDDIRFISDGMVLRIRSSKADQEGEGADVGIIRGSGSETCPVRAMETWLRRAAISYGAVFRRIRSGGRLDDRLTGDGVWKILRRRAAAVELKVDDGERLSPHGLRAGCITEAYLNGALDEQAGHHARQKSLNTTRGYRRRAKTIAASPTRLLNL